MARILITVPDRVMRSIKSWRKVVFDVDMTKSTGYAFNGEFLQTGKMAEVDIGAFIIVYDETPNNNELDEDDVVHPLVRPLRGNENHIEVKFYQVERDGSLREMFSVEGRSWAIQLRDLIAPFFRGNNTLTPEEEELVEKLLDLPADRRGLVLMNLREDIPPIVAPRPIGAERIEERDEDDDFWDPHF